MEEFWILILVALFVTMSLDKAESVQLEELEELEELPLQTFDELFVEEWLDKDEADDLKTPAPRSFGQNVHHQIDRQNNQLGQFEPNSTDQNPPLTESDHSGQFEPNSTDQNPLLTESDHSGQIEPNSTDQNPPLTESDHSGQIEPNSTDQNPLLTESDHSGQIEPNSTEQNSPLIEYDHSDYTKNVKENIAKDERKRKIIDKFHTIKDEFKQKGKYSAKEWVQIEIKIAKHLKVNRTKIYKWKKELGISGKANGKEERKHLIERFIQMKAELKRDGFKNSFKNELDKTVAKKLGLGDTTIYAWKRELGQSKPNPKYPHSEQNELMKLYYEIKDQNPKINDADIAKMLKIGRDTLVRWKKKFKRQQLHPNSVDGHSVEENFTSNVQEIGSANSESI